VGNQLAKQRVRRQCVAWTGVGLAGALIFAPVAQAQTNGVKALLVGGQGSYATLTDQQMETAFGGYFANYDSRTSVPFPGEADFSVSIPEGATNLYNAVVAQPAGTVMTIGGVSKGAPSVIYALKQIEAARANTTDGVDVPDADHLNVMIYGAPSRLYYAGVKYRPDIPVTPYDVYLVSAEYDGVADMPDNMLNILAVLNAVQGADMLHVDAAFNTDFENDPMRYKVETNKAGGTTTTILIPYTDPIIPLLHPMLEAGGDPAQLAKLSAMLKPIIDSAYKRNNTVEKKKWKTGIVNIPLPAAAPPPAPAPTPDPGGETLRTAAVETQQAASTDYVGKHRAEPIADPAGDGGSVGDGGKKIPRNFFKQLSDDFKKLTTKKSKTGSTSGSASEAKSEEKEAAAPEPAKESTSESNSGSDTGANSGTSDSGSES
jgi:3'-(hydroxy)phthioceranyl-2'-palmitoyl(stearoyl)-2-O-sulfo-trehalose (hydroxy)phthioceranyltransferase